MSDTTSNRQPSILRRAALAALFSAFLVSSLGAQTTGKPRLFLNSDGSVNGVLAPAGSALFTPSGDVLGSFRQWVRGRTALLRLAPMADDTALAGLAPERDPVSRSGSLSIHRLVQTYRGYPVVGPAERVSVLADQEGRVLGYAGTVIDARIDYAGLDRPIRQASAAQAALSGWEARHGAGEPRVDSVSLVAVPALRTMGYRGEVLSGDEVVGATIVSAADGSVLAVDDLRHRTAFNHRPVRAIAYAMTNNPATTTTASFQGLPGSTFGGVCQPNPPSIGCTLRMGNERAAVYDFENDNSSAPTIWTTFEYQPHPTQKIPWGWFLANDTTTFQFKTQNVFQKMAAALAMGDAAKGGAGWDHHPNAPFGLFQAPPVSVFTNVDGTPEGAESDPCNGAMGVTSLYTFNNTWAPVEHPYISNSYTSVAIYLCNQDESVLFHELGHYYDMHSAFNVLGAGLASNTCHGDTTDESISLAETVADLSALYFDRKLYPTLSFTLSTTPTSCAFTSLGRGTSAIHGGACTVSVASFQTDRPTESNVSACTPTQGYRLASAQQAAWEFLWGKNCAVTAPYACAQSAVDPDSFMTALLLAEGVSNLQSYEQFFEMMDLALLVEEGQATADLFRAIFSHHGIIDP